MPQTLQTKVNWVYAVRQNFWKGIVQIVKVQTGDFYAIRTSFPVGI